MSFNYFLVKLCSSEQDQFKFLVRTVHFPTHKISLKQLLKEFIYVSLKKALQLFKSRLLKHFTASSNTESQKIMSKISSNKFSKFMLVLLKNMIYKFLSIVLKALLKTFLSKWVPLLMNSSPIYQSILLSFTTRIMNRQKKVLTMMVKLN